MIAKIYLNLGIINSQQGDNEQAMHYHRRSLELKTKELPAMHEEIMNSYVLLAHECTKLGHHEQACKYYQRIITICKTVHGENTESTAYSMV